MQTKFIHSKWIAPKWPFVEAGMYALAMKVYDTPSWLDGIVWCFITLLAVGTWAQIRGGEFVEPVIKE